MNTIDVEKIVRDEVDRFYDELIELRNKNEKCTCPSANGVMIRNSRQYINSKCACNVDRDKMVQRIMNANIKIIYGIANINPYLYVAALKIKDLSVSKVYEIIVKESTMKFNNNIILTFSRECRITNIGLTGIVENAVFNCLEKNQRGQRSKNQFHVVVGKLSDYLDINSVLIDKKSLKELIQMEIGSKVNIFKNTEDNKIYS